MTENVLLLGLRRDTARVSNAILPSEKKPAQADILLCYIQPPNMTEAVISESVCLLLTLISQRKVEVLF